MYLQKLLQTQSIDWTKQGMTKGIDIHKHRCSRKKNIPDVLQFQEQNKSASSSYMMCQNSKLEAIKKRQQPFLTNTRPPKDCVEVWWAYGLHKTYIISQLSSKCTPIIIIGGRIPKIVAPPGIINTKKNKDNTLCIHPPKNEVREEPLERISDYPL